MNKYSVSLGNQQNPHLNEVLLAYFISAVIKDDTQCSQGWSQMTSTLQC